LLEGVIGELKKQSSQPETPALIVLATMEAAHYRLQNGDLVGTKAAIEACCETAEALTGVDTLIPATYYRVCADYDKMSLSFTSFYRKALLYLSYVEVEGLPLAESQERAHDLCVAALLGETIYNFGELLANPILSVLNDTSFAYLVETLMAFNAGDHAAFERLFPLISQHPTLGGRLDALRQKLCLMALVEAVFVQLKTSRTITFAQISQATRVPVTQVEFLLMKALSMALLRGDLHEPEQAFRIEWVQPRVLDRKQIAELRDGIRVWRSRVQHTAQLIHTLVPEQLAGVSN
jgi:26S proteasome regulatory subunit N9